MRLLQRIKKQNRKRSIYLTFALLFLSILLFISCAQTNQAKKQEPLPDFDWEKQKGLVLAGRYRAVSSADLDGDGNPDLIGGASSPGEVSIWYGKGAEGMEEPQVLSAKGDVQSLSPLDYNGDGLVDIVLSVQKQASGLLILQNLGNRKWELKSGPVEVNLYQGVANGDINQDGYPDIIAANMTSEDSGGIQVWLGDGKGGWLAEAGPTVTGIYMDAAVGDFNEDGFPDLAGSGWGKHGALRVWVGNGTGAWISSSFSAPGSFYRLTIEDVNSDGHLDILAGTYRAGVRVFKGNGKGGFSEIPTDGGEGSFWQVVSTDFDKDGKKDLIAGSLLNKGLSAWSFPDASHLVPVENKFPKIGIYYDLTFLDLDKNGTDEICVTHFGEGIKIWSGREGGFKEPRTDRPAGVQWGMSNEDAGHHGPVENEVFKTIGGVAEYKVGPGDILEVLIWKGTEPSSTDVPVRPDGRISFGFADNVYVKGLTTSEIDHLITDELEKYIKHPRIDVHVKEFESKYVTFMGAIGGYSGRSGAARLPLDGKLRVTEMLSKAGGPNTDANLRQVKIRRKDRTSFTVDLYKALTQGDVSQDVVLDDGDVVFVPAVSKEDNRVYVFGEVNKPGVYPFVGSDLKLFDAISQAGGTTLFAKGLSTKVVRGDIAAPEILSADLDKLLTEGDYTQNIALKNGDLVYVPKTYVGDVRDFMKKIQPIMQLIFLPAALREEYFSTDSEFLRFNK